MIEGFISVSSTSSFAVDALCLSKKAMWRFEAAHSIDASSAFNNLERGGFRGTEVLPLPETVGRGKTAQRSGRRAEETGVGLRLRADH
jgi:hypothetical protein